MNTAEKRKVQVLILVTVILALSLYLNYFSPDQISSPQITQQKEAIRTNPGPLPSYDLLVRNRVSSVRVKRNIFDFDDEAGTEPMASSGSISIPSATAILPEPVQVPNVRYLGFYFEKENKQERYAAISNTGKVAVGREGETILSGKYQVLRIEPEYVLLLVVSEEKTLRLPLGNRPGEFIDQDEGGR